MKYSMKAVSAEKISLKSLSPGETFVFGDFMSEKSVYIRGQPKNENIYAVNLTDGRVSEYADTVNVTRVVSESEIVFKSTIMARLGW